VTKKQPFSVKIHETIYKTGILPQIQQPKDLTTKMRTTTRAPWANPVITGEDIARDAMDDFENFFEVGFGIKIALEVGDVDYAVTRGAASNAKIIISREMASEIINTPKDFFFNLLIIGHEISHAILMHNLGRHLEYFEYRSLEMWADFYGTKIMMCLITYGRNLRSMFETFFPEDPYFPRDNFRAALDAIGQAVGDLCEHVYRSHSHYPHPIVRVASIANGLISFFGREKINLHPIWPYSIIKRVYSSSPARDLKLLFGQRIEEGFAMNEPARKWHIEMQDTASEIVPGMKMKIKIHLFSSFKQTKGEWRSRCRKRQESLIKMRLLKRSNRGKLLLGPGPRVNNITAIGIHTKSKHV